MDGGTRPCAPAGRPIARASRHRSVLVVSVRRSRQVRPLKERVLPSLDGVRAQKGGFTRAVNKGSLQLLPWLQHGTGGQARPHARAAEAKRATRRLSERGVASTGRVQQKWRDWAPLSDIRGTDSVGYSVQSTVRDRQCVVSVDAIALDKFRMAARGRVV